MRMVREEAERDAVLLLDKPLTEITLSSTLLYNRFVYTSVAQEVEQLSTNLKIGGSIPGSFSSHVDGSLGKKNPNCS